MARNRSRTNPFFVLLVLFGITFSLTACAYGMMAFRAARGGDVAALEQPRASPAGQALLVFLDKHGAVLLGVELALLALASFGAIATDGYWSRTLDRRSSAAATEKPVP